ncbi:MAG: hypothetical protein [Circular genetic element sp.]|nr:MAG: hypothetical protein [Circular genetic element sp.]
MPAKKPLQHPATLKSLCPGNNVSYGPGPGQVTLSAGPWFTLTTLAGLPIIYWEGSIDLGAYVLKDLTWVTMEKDIQEPGNFEMNFATPQRMEVIEFVSNTQFNKERLTEIADDWEVHNAVPGMMESRINYENIIDGRWRQFSPDTTLATGSAVTMKASSFGSCEPSASERLYTYVMIKTDVPGAPLDRISIPPRRFLLGGVAVKEDDNAYIQRLRRSYVLQQEVPQ